MCHAGNGKLHFKILVVVAREDRKYILEVASVFFTTTALAAYQA